MINHHAFTSPYEEIAHLARAFGNGRCLMLLNSILQGELSVDRLAAACELSVANASQHLQHLKRAGLVSTRRHGKRIFYKAGSGPVREILTSLQDYLSHTQEELQRA